MRIPLMFIRRRKCTPENGLKPNSHINGDVFLSVVVMFPTYCDEKIYRSAWMNDPVLSQVDDDSDYTTVPDVDIVADENVFIFDSDDVAKNYRDALVKMKELWAQVDPNL